MFSKQTMEEELIEFIEAYRLADDGLISRRHSKEIPARSETLFQICSSLYDYAFLGIKSKHPQLQFLGTEYPIDGPMADTEMFLLGIEISNLYMDLYYQEVCVRPPIKAVRTVQAAVARHVLSGGERYTTPVDLGFAHDSLSFHDIALLADMDEKSVRNAANPKHKEPLVTTVSGRRTWITRENALNWLSKRRGFVPSQE